MNDLMQLQTDFQNYILHQDQCMDDNVISTKKVSAPERLAIYANGYRYRLIDILFEDYEKLSALLGEDQFIACANAYIDAYPSTYPSVRWFGQHMSEFLRDTEPYAEHPFLAEMAQFEWGLMSTFDAPDNTLINVEKLKAISPNDWGNMCFSFTSSLARLHLKWNTVTLWKALDEEKEPPLPNKLESPQTWLLWRKDLETNYRSTTVEEAWAIDQAIQGKSFAAICEGLNEWVDEEQIAAQAASFLKTWLTEGVVTRIT